MAAKARAATRAPERTTPEPAPEPKARAARSKAAVTAMRKPLLARENQIDVPSSNKPASGISLKAEKETTSSAADCEPVTAYLRIRPYLGGDTPAPTPYLEPLSSTTVRMVDPNSSDAQLRYRTSTITPSSTYTFSHVFPPSTKQSDFFTKSTLPLVKDVLNGQNALLFAYGVTNSGKTYTVQGGSGKGKKEGTAGILPRTLDVIFNSIEGLQSDGSFRPVRLYGIEASDPSASSSPNLSIPLPQSEPAVAQVLADHLNASPSLDIDPTVIKLDRNYEYSIWISYVEVYNEKVYDLLANVKGSSDHMQSSNIPRPVATSQPVLLMRKALAIRPSPPGDAPDPDSPTSGKYIAGLRQFRVTSAEQAKGLVKLGQLNRRVFGTLANSQSSRSHGLVTIRVVRGHRGEKDDPTALQISRLTLVDLAGSERTKHTQTTGDRLKEAGSINKSLMVLGQCMEVMRVNQRKVAVSLATNGRSDTRDVKRRLGVIPFRHSKLTEILGDYFVGDGRVVIIINVNPYDTGYDENAHVMKFAAVAREVNTTVATAPLQRIPSSPTKPAFDQGKDRGPLKDPEIVPLPFVKRKVMVEMKGKSGKKESDACLEVVEEDEDVVMNPADDSPGDEVESGSEGINPLVNALFDEVETLRLKLFEAEMRCAVIEAETREEVMREMEERMRSMEKLYQRRLMKEVEQNELKTDAKIDLLHQSKLSSPVKGRSAAAKWENFYDNDEEEDVKMSIMTADEPDTEDDQQDHSASDDELMIDVSVDTSMDEDLINSPAPCRHESPHKEIREAVPAGPPALPLPEGFDGDEERDAEEDVTDSEESKEDDEDDSTEGSENGGEEDSEDSEQSDEDEWLPPPAPVPTATRRSTRIAASAKATVPSSRGNGSGGRSNTPVSRMSTLENGLADMSLSSAATDDSVVIQSVKKGSSPVKKKREVGKNTIDVNETSKPAAKSERGRNLTKNRGRS